MEPIGLMHIEVVLIRRDLIEEIYDEFKKTGELGFERLALWAGEKSGREFTVTHILYPKQYLTKGPSGVSFSVDGEELERIGNWLYDNKCSLIAQIHSHPKEAYHSEADDDLCIITTFGGLSIVVPDFGNTDYCLDQSAIFRLLRGTGWTKLSETEKKCLIKIIE